MQILDKFKEQLFLRRLCIIFLICLLLNIFNGLINVLLLTLIFTLLTDSISKILLKFIKIPRKIIIYLVYIFIIIIIYFLLNYLINEIITSFPKLIILVNEFYTSNDSSNHFIRIVSEVFQRLNITSYLDNISKLALNYASHISHFGITILVSFILSFFFVIDKDKIHSFSKSFLTSRYHWIFEDIAFLSKKFISSFGIVLETQFIISIINTTLTIIGLYFLGFSSLPVLAGIIFVLGLIPVAGVIISCIPLSLIAYATGGFEKIIYLIILIIVIHMIETYFLNPKLMSSKTNLPIFYVFLVLFISEQIFGIWGLIIGIPIFIFILNLLEIDLPNKKL